MTPFTPLRLLDGYPPIEDHGLIGDGTTAALVARNGAIVWLCAPRFDSPPLFCALLDAARGGAFTVAPEGLEASRQFYQGDSGVLVTELRAPGALVRLTDALPLRSGADLDEDASAGRGELLRLVDNLVHRGRVEEALALFESLCARANPLGLLPEQIDPTTGAFRGNFPQALSHVGLVSSAVNLERALAGRR